MSLITTKFHAILQFQWSCADKLCWVVSHFGQISKFKKSVIQRKKMESKFPVDICTCTHYVLRNYKISRNSESFRGVALIRKTVESFILAEFLSSKWV